VGATKEIMMVAWFIRLLHDAGPGKAVENARRERDETARMLAQIAEIEARLAAA
jgi:hypothetical protein